jgi:branched-chain amino acid transport system ATP-binding protein
MSLELRDVHARYGKSHVLHGVDLSVEHGTIVTLIGRNGVGRSTTLKAIVGMVETDRGSILLDGCEQRGRRTFEIVRSGIAYVPEERLIFDNLTVEENLVLGMQRARSECAAWSVKDMYAFFPLLLERRNAQAGRLSGGEQQMLTICRSLLGNPRFMLVDEPTEGLAPLIVQRLVDVIREIRRRGVAMLLVEQKMTIAFEVSDRVDVMGHGRVVFSGTPDALKHDTEVQRRWLEVSDSAARIPSTGALETYLLRTR